MFWGCIHVFITKRYTCAWKPIWFWYHTCILEKKIKFPNETNIFYFLLVYAVNDVLLFVCKQVAYMHNVLCSIQVCYCSSFCREKTRGTSENVQGRFSISISMNGLKITLYSRKSMLMCNINRKLKLNGNAQGLFSTSACMDKIFRLLSVKLIFPDVKHQKHALTDCCRLFFYGNA